MARGRPKRRAAAKAASKSKKVVEEKKQEQEEEQEQQEEEKKKKEEDKTETIEKEDNTFLSKSLKDFVGTNNKSIVFNRLRNEIPEVLAEYMFAVCEPVLVRDVLKLVEDEQETYNKMKNRFRLLILLDYVLDAEQNGEELEEYLKEFQRLTREQQDHVPQKLKELAQFVICEFKFQICLAYARTAVGLSSTQEDRSSQKEGARKPKKLKAYELKKKFEDLYSEEGDSEISVEKLMTDEQDRAVLLSLIATQRDDLDTVIFTNRRKKRIIDKDAVRDLETEHPWSEFKTSFKSYIEQLQIHTHGLPKLMKLYETDKEIKDSDGQAITKNVAKKEARMMELKATFQELGGTEEEWNNAAESAQSNYNAFQVKLQQLMQEKKAQNKKQSSSFPQAQIIVPVDEQFDDIQIDPKEIINRHSGYDMLVPTTKTIALNSKKRTRPSESETSKSATSQPNQKKNKTKVTEVLNPFESSDEEDEEAEETATDVSDEEAEQVTKDKVEAPKAAESDDEEDSENSRSKSNSATHKKETTQPHREVVIPREIIIKSNVQRQKRVRWSEAELEALKRGIDEFGEGSWSQILRMSDAFHSTRTGVSLKDKWRNYRKQLQREGISE